jgi:hypothetical protein
VLIATPGRLLDHFERGKLLLTGVDSSSSTRPTVCWTWASSRHRAYLQADPVHTADPVLSATMPPEIPKHQNSSCMLPRGQVAKAATTAATVTQRLSSRAPSPGTNAPCCGI